MDSLRGSLLIAAPALSDYFRRTVVLVIEHGDEGAMGVVLNHRTELPVPDAAPALGELADEGDVVHVGGPVAPQAVVALAAFVDPDEAALMVVDELGLVDPERTDVTVHALRVYAGYAGWAPGQLEAEIQAEGWFVEAADSLDPFRDGDLWSTALQRKGGEYALLASMPADPSLN